MVGKKNQVNKYQSFVTIEPYLTSPGKKTGLVIKTRWSPRESKIDLALVDNRSWEQIVGGIYAK